MQARTGLLALLGAVTLLSACAPSGTPHLMNPRSTTGGPDEFAILPPKGLEMPKDLAALPPPTPGGANLTDRDPTGDAIIALGGKVAKPTSGYPAADAGLVGFADRFGAVPADIRAELAAADLQWRQTHQGLLLQRWFNMNTYFEAYLPFALDQYGELQYWRSQGVATPAAPPHVTKK
jgi:hypothetical protein